MIKHIIIWKLKEMPEEEKNAQLKLIKEKAEELNGKIPGMKELKVNIAGLDTSNGDAMLDSTFEYEEALHAYHKNPEHNAMANTYIRPFVETRLCVDYML